MATDPESTTEQARLIADAAWRLFANIGRSVFDLVEDGGWPADAWTAVEAAGMHMALVPETAGGYGLPLSDGLAIVRLAGQAALPLPLPETMVANWLLSQAGIAAGPGPMTFGFAGGALERCNTGWKASGRIARVPWARRCGVVVLASHEDRHLVFHVPQGAGLVTHGTNIAGEPRDDLQLDDMELGDEVRPVTISPAQLRLAGAAVRTLQIAGALNEVLRMTRAFVQERNQFGKPLGSFQAIQHQVARLASETAAANVSSDLAIEAFAAESGLQAIASAKTRAGEAAGIAAGIAHQIHGAMGFTREFRLHLFVRRLWSWRDEFGGEAEWSQTLGRVLAAAGAEELWTELTAI